MIYLTHIKRTQTELSFYISRLLQVIYRQSMTKLVLMTSLLMTLSVASDDESVVQKNFKAKLTTSQFNAIWSKREFNDTNSDSEVGFYLYPKIAKKNIVKDEVIRALVNSAENWDEIDSGYQYILELSTALGLDVRADADGNIIDIIPYSNYWLDNPLNLDIDVLNAQYQALDWDKKIDTILSMNANYRGKIVRVYYCGDSEGCPKGVSGWYHPNKNLLLDDNELDIPPRDNKKDLRLHVYAIGAGNCTVIECPDSNEAIVADCGSTGDARYPKTMFPTNSSQVLSPPAGSTERPIPYEINFFLSKLYEVLKDKSEVTIVLSHSDIDHYNYFEFFTHNFFGSDILSNLKALYVGGQFNQYNSDIDIPATIHGHFGDDAANKVYAMGEVLGQPYTHVEKYIDRDASGRAIRRNIRRWTAQPIYSLDETQNGVLKTEPPSCGAATVDILAVNAEEEEWKIKNGSDPRSNQRSLVLRVSYQGKSIILPGDATETALRKTLTNGIGQSTIVVAPHHGSAEKKSHLEEWIEKVNPEYLVFSSGKSKHGHPNLTTYNRYNHSGSQLLDADEHKFFVYNGHNASSQTVTSNKQIFSTYFDGSVVFTINGTGSSANRVEADCYGPFLNLDKPDDDEPEFSHWCSPLKR
ncbi:ComEC/Rec2 family competence protein [Pleionea sediminis]|uniref:ComEC/Rec2 family competence protein n=1 Tax=Pleionea sediminis TaxID=2569479 RepID=UPI0011851DB7|nr:hypothetical protein [Pleionea sediminis]